MTDGGRGLGKVILLGEHAVVHGHPALAGAVDLDVVVRATPSAAPRLRAPGWSLDVALADAAHPVARAAAAIAGALGAGPPAHDLEVAAALPAAAGLGSSAALSVAIARALASARRVDLDDAAVEALATAGERTFHGNPSGVDVALATRGGLGLYRRGDGLRPLAAPPLPVAVGLSGQPRATAAMVARVAEALAARPDDAGAALRRLGEASARGAALLASASADLPALGALLTAAHRDLASLGVSTPTLDALVEAALRAGALGAKLTGAGGGGAVIALAPGREDAVRAAWRRLGHDGLRCSVGVRP